MSQERADRIRENFLRQGGRGRAPIEAPAVEADRDPQRPGKRADERVISISVDEILPDRYQGRLRWPIELGHIEKLYDGTWVAQELIDYVATQRHENDAVQHAWQQTIDLANSILADGQVAPITVSPARNLPSGYRFVIETGEGRFWAYQVMRWLLANAPEQIGVERDDWQEDPDFIRAVAVTTPSRLRQVAENEQRQSYASAVDRAIAYASMLAEDSGQVVEGTPPGIRDGVLVLPDAYWKAARRGLRGKGGLIAQLPASRRQIQRHLKLLTSLDPEVLAISKQHNLSEAQLRPLVTKSAPDQRELIGTIVAESLSSREAQELSEQLADAQIYDIDGALSALRGTQEMETDESEAEAVPLTLPEEVAKLVRVLTRVAGRYEALREKATDRELLLLLEDELARYDDRARGAQRTRTPRRRLARLFNLLQQLGDE